jgi:hypothetical protein
LIHSEQAPSAPSAHDGRWLARQGALAFLLTGMTLGVNVVTGVVIARALGRGCARRARGASCAAARSASFASIEPAGVAQKPASEAANLREALLHLTKAGISPIVTRTDQDRSGPDGGGTNAGGDLRLFRSSGGAWD